MRLFRDADSRGFARPASGAARYLHIGANSPALAASWLLLTGCLNARQAKSPDVDTQAVRSAPDASGETVRLRLYNTYIGAADPRFGELPQRLQQVELTPAVTLQLETALPAASVLFELDGRRRMDSSAPFLLTEATDGHAEDWALAPGVHRLNVTAYSGPNGRGWVLAKTSRTFELLTVGVDATPAEGEHQAYLFWLTNDGRYVTRTAAGDFVDLRGDVVLSKDEVKVEQREGEQGYIVSLAAGAKTLEFAFQVLLPDGYSPDVHYPLIVYLHHGWSVFRGTDNDGRMLTECPIFAGEQSLTRSLNRTRYPAVLLVPQMIKKETRSGVEQEWGAFSDLDNTSGTVKSAPTPSVSGAFTRKVLDDLLLGALPVARARLAVDRDRIYLTGHSMGGLGTWDFTQRWPELWAAAVPMAGYSDHALAARVMSVPIWAFHHVSDCYNPVLGTQTMQRQIELAGGRLSRFTELSFDTEGKCEQAHFRTPEFAWREPELPLWLFSQVRTR